MNIDFYSIILQSLTATLTVSVAISVVFYFFNTAKRQRDELRSRQVELSLMRENLETRMYDINRALMSNEERWKDVNHLLVRNNIEYSRGDFSRSHSYRNNSFIVKSGVNLDNLKIDKRSVFVLMPFHSDFDKVFDTIKRACSDFKIRCSRGDEEFRPGNIMPTIIEGIISSGVVLCLLDGRNPNVYYELGLTHGLDKPAILIAGKEGGAVPFDIQSRRIIFFETLDELSERVKDAILNTLID